MGAVVFFAFILFVMGGVTAYMGDRLGSYIGKKRHSTFGLRPRHTAMLWTVVSGGVIAVGTLLLFLALNRTFSTALVRGPQLLETNGTLQHQNLALARHNVATERRAREDDARASRAQAQAAQARKGLAQVAAVLGRAQNTLARSRQTLAQRQAELDGAQRRLADARRGLDTTHAELRRAEDSVHQARVGVREARRQAQLADAQAVRASRDVLTLGIKEDALRIEQNTLTAENKALARRSQAQQALLLTSQGRSLVFRRSEELGRTVVSTGQPVPSVRRELAVFLDQVELTARQRGAGGLDNSPAVVLAAPAPVEGAEAAAETREAVLDALSESIAAQGGQPSVVVVADARYNTFNGEPVKLDLKPYANDLVFPRGTVIASRAINGEQSQTVILGLLQSFLTDQVRVAARRRGIIPVPDPQSGDPRVGQPIDTPTALALVRQIQQAGPDARVTAAAAADTYSADLLRLDLRVTPAPPKPDTAQK